jgi:hypothetical protein
MKNDVIFHVYKSLFIYPSLFRHCDLEICSRVRMHGIFVEAEVRLRVSGGHVDTSFPIYIGLFLYIYASFDMLTLKLPHMCMCGLFAEDEIR